MSIEKTWKQILSIYIFQFFPQTNIWNILFKEGKKGLFPLKTIALYWTNRNVEKPACAWRLFTHHRVQETRRCNPKYGARKQLPSTWDSSLCCQVLQRSQWEGGKKRVTDFPVKKQVIFGLLPHFGSPQDVHHTLKSASVLYGCFSTQTSVLLSPNSHSPNLRKTPGSAASGSSERCHSHRRVAIVARAWEARTVNWTACSEPGNIQGCATQVMAISWRLDSTLIIDRRALYRECWIEPVSCGDRMCPLL